MFLESFKITSVAVAQSFLLAAIGYFLVKKNILSKEGLSALSRLVVEVTLPILIFCQLINNFKFSLLPNWWVFPLISIGLSAVSLFIGFLFLGFIKGAQEKTQFLSLVTFQNSGYLPLVIIAALLPQEKTGAMFTYLFLFLLGFNLVLFSIGAHLILFQKHKKFEWVNLFNPPVVSTILTLILIFFGVNNFIPRAVLSPLKMAGDCTLPLAMFVLGAGLAEIRLAQINKRAVFLLSLVKLIMLPALGILFIMKFKVPELVSLLIVMELAMPPATLLSSIIRSYNKEDLLISQGIFFGHIISIVTIPLFLSLYFIINMLQ